MNPNPAEASQEQILDLARRLAFDSPQLIDLTPAQLEHLAQVVVLANLRDELKRLADLSRIDCEAEMKTFLLTVSKTGSWRTIEAYIYGIAKLDEWAWRQGLVILELNARHADDYIYDLRARGDAPATIRLAVAGVSSFFSFLERRFEVVRNPFRGTKARPANIPRRELLIPTKPELDAMLDAAEPVLAAAMTCMSERGFRIGALPTLVIEGDRFHGRSKGKEIYGHMPGSVLEAFGLAKLNPRRPFGGMDSRRLSERIRLLAQRLAKLGRVRAAFSAHDLRHYFAVTEYQKTPDLYRLKGLLGHHSVSVTERYLRTIRIL